MSATVSGGLHLFSFMVEPGFDLWEHAGSWVKPG